MTSTHPPRRGRHCGGCAVLEGGRPGHPETRLAGAEQDDGGRVDVRPRLRRVAAVGDEQERMRAAGGVRAHQVRGHRRPRVGDFQPVDGSVREVAELVEALPVRWKFDSRSSSSLALRRVTLNEFA